MCIYIFIYLCQFYTQERFLQAGKSAERMSLKVSQESPPPFAKVNQGKLVQIYPCCSTLPGAAEYGLSGTWLKPGPG